MQFPLRIICNLLIHSDLVSNLQMNLKIIYYLTYSRSISFLYNLFSAHYNRPIKYLLQKNEEAGNQSM